MTKGFTLIELICVLAVFAVMLAVVFYVHGRRERSQRTINAVTNVLLADIRYVRRRAIVEGVEVGIRFDRTRNRYCIIYPNPSPPEIIRTVYLPEYVWVEGFTRERLVFLPRGTPSGGGFSVHIWADHHRTTISVVASGGRVRVSNHREVN